MDEKIVNNLKSESRWLRLIFMILFAALGYLAILVILVLACVQAIAGFITGSPNTRLLEFSSSLNQFTYQCIQFLTYNSEEKPFPFSDWPGEPTYNEDDDPYLNMDAADIPEQDQPEEPK